MIIDQLPALATAGDNDEIAIEVGTTTYKIKKSDFLKEFMPKTGGTFSGDITVNGGLIDVIKRRCYIYPSTAGWYRVLELDNGSASSFVMVSMGNTIVRVDIAVNNNYETHTIALRASSSSGPAFSEETSKASSTLKVNKIRYVKQDDNIKSYVDIYVDTSSAVSIGVSFDITTSRLDRQPMFSSVQTLTSVADSPSGETVLAAHKFTTDTTYKALTFTRTNNSYYNATEFGRITGYSKDDNIYINLNLRTSAAIPANTPSFEIGTITLPANRQIGTPIYMNIPTQDATAAVLLIIYTDGRMTIGNNSSSQIGALIFHRAHISNCLIPTT